MRLFNLQSCTAHAHMCYCRVRCMSIDTTVAETSKIMGPAFAKKAGTNQNNKRKRSRNKQTKIHLVFDEEQRRDYLKGFKKRKDERRQKAQEEIEIKLREEKRKNRVEQREMLKSMINTNHPIPEVDQLVTPVTYDLPNHTVTIVSVTDVDFQGNGNLLVGPNKETNEDSENEEETKAKPLESLTNEAKISLQRNLKKAQLKKMKTSKVGNLKQKIQQKKDRLLARKKRNICRKREKHKGGKKR